MKSYNEMAESVLSRRDEYVKKRKKQTRTFASGVLCLALIAGIGFGFDAFGGKPAAPEATDSLAVEKTGSKYVNMENIHVNEVGGSGDAELLCDIDCQYEAYKSKIDGVLQFVDDVKNEEFLKNMGMSWGDFTAKLPNGFDLQDMCALYVTDRPGSGEYNIFHDYVLRLKDTQSDAELTLAMSPLEKPLRDCFYLNDDPIYSEINGVKLVIMGDGNIFYTIFEYNGIWYDIETYHISLEDFVILLNSIIS